MTVTLRPIDASDRDQILRWRNAPHVAEYMYTNHEISQDDHKRMDAEVQKATDQSIHDIDQMLATKEKEIMTV